MRGEWSGRCPSCLEVVVQRTNRGAASNLLRSPRNKCEQNPDRVPPKPKPVLRVLARVEDLRIELQLDDAEFRALLDEIGIELRPTQIHLTKSDAERVRLQALQRK